MNSAKTIVVVFVFLGVVYGVYQVVNKKPYIEDDSPIVNESGDPLVSEFGPAIDPMELTDAELDAALFGSESSNETAPDDDGGFDLSFGGNTETDSTLANEQLNAASPPPAPSANQFNGGSFTAPETDGSSIGEPATNFDVAITNPPPRSDSLKSEFPEFRTPDKEPVDLSLDPETTPAFNAGFSSPNSEANSPVESANPVQAPADTSNTGDLGQSFNNSPNVIKNQFVNPGSNPGFGSEPRQGVIKNEFVNNTGNANDITELQPAPRRQFDSVKPAPVTPELSTAASDLQAEAAFTEQLKTSWNRALNLIDQDNYREGLEILSAYHGDPRLTEEELVNLESWIDPLAGKVIYSTEHFVAKAHMVQPGETLQSIAANYNISPQLMYNINRVNIADPNQLTPGTALKVVNGPFNATIDRKSNKLTLYLGKMYAGSFVVSFGNQGPRHGSFQVEQRLDRGKEYVDASGRRIAANDADNPYGQYVLDLGNGVSIHGSSSEDAAVDTRGSISLSPIDAEDVFGILSVGSVVDIR